MPIYEYECGSCGHKMEKLQKISADPLKDCPDCQQPNLKKLVSAAGFRLKGGGWYETDFKTGNKRNVSSDTSDNSSSGGAASSTTGKSSDSPKTSSSSD